MVDTLRWLVTRERGMGGSTAPRSGKGRRQGPPATGARPLGDVFPTLLPFPALRMGWGLDVHWAAVARDHGWRIGVIDATPVAHLGAPAASAYSRAEAQAEAERFLAGRPYVTRDEADRTLAVHRRP